ncbi:hypothetical protein WSS_A38276 [Rhodococcus opacus M213]|uniref:Uncharacterized protein n=1 Tax=Rhodococcus opacus M213 TaxID=1129896 RepID=K8X916_RHOOP|nr:hypothetical protein [Rhodococcus opacus]EKT77331.1 hypothetical protein WSS_A38276 [Rhodococcus opacus M213]
MRIDEMCATENNPWSIISSSATNSTLAGVLAAFLIAAIAVLFTKEHEAYVQTMSLFASALVVLALDSYLFSHITGIQPTVLRMPELGTKEAEFLYDDTYLNACARAWTQGMPASGMLATGGVAVIAGLSWMLAIHGSTARPVQPFLAQLGGWLTGVVIGTSTLLLTATTIQYLEFLYKDDVNNWVETLVWLGALGAVVWAGGSIFCRTRKMSRTLKAAAAVEAARKHAALAEAALRGVVRKAAQRKEAARVAAVEAEVARKKVRLAEVALKELVRKAAPRKEAEANAAGCEGSGVSTTAFTLDMDLLKPAAVCIAGLAAVGPLFAGFLTRMSEDFAAEPDWRVLVAALLTGLVFPVMISILISLSVPSPGPRKHRLRNLLHRHDQ